jgi:hypothetical protein
VQSHFPPRLTVRYSRQSGSLPSVCTNARRALRSSAVTRGGNGCRTLIIVLMLEGSSLIDAGPSVTKAVGIGRSTPAKPLPSAPPDPLHRTKCPSLAMPPIQPMFDGVIQPSTKHGPHPILTVRQGRHHCIGCAATASHRRSHPLISEAIKMAHDSKHFTVPRRNLDLSKNDLEARFAVSADALHEAACDQNPQLAPLWGQVPRAVPLSFTLQLPCMQGGCRDITPHTRKLPN